MNLKANVPLGPYTTFHIGGPARFLIEANTEKDIEDAVAFSRERRLPLYPLGAGSNVLVPDDGVEGVVLHMVLGGVAFENDGTDTLLVGGAGVLWDTVVDAACKRSIFGIENLAGVPGTLGGAAVQNIGAYGAEFVNVFEYADTIHRETGERRRITRDEAALAYRTSIFKKQRDYIITRIALRFKPDTVPNISYPDLKQRQARGEALATPADIARTVRSIRAEKFPPSAEGGTAGSFFKNPIVPRAFADALAKRFPGLPLFPQGNTDAKVSLAWLLDHALSLKGYAAGTVRLYEKQPLVIVAREGATAAQVDAHARTVAEQVFETIGITVEREVETFGITYFS
ncbi:UDP-N-acetylmuramate dehydrogenase [Candidatus Parcubacteria bacterium]|nr:UDP-N-acetylmuramate dehydrogenase [Candidatus Parcubacteria bacterium]